MRYRIINRTQNVLLALTVASLLSACGEETDQPLESFVNVPLIASVSGRVGSGMTGVAIAGAIANVGAVTATANASGRFQLIDVPASSRTLVHLAAPGYVDGYQVTSTVLGSTSSVTAQLLPFGADVSVSAAAGGTVTAAGSPATLTITGNSLTQGDGAPASGSVSLRVTSVNPAQNLISMPGDFTTSTNQSIESFGAVAVGAVDASGNPLDLASGQTAPIRILYASRNTETPPSSLSLYYFDTASGYWVEQGTATLSGTAPNQFYQGTIGRLGAWTVGRVLNPTVFLNGCIRTETDNLPVANVRVQAEGINYSGMSTAISGSDGRFRMAIKSAGAVLVSGQLGNFVTNSLSAGPSTTEITLPSCLQLVALSGAPRITLTWGAIPGDVDSHLFAPDGTHVYYANKGTLSANPFIKLDVDDTGSFGPEVITLTRLMVGTYTYGVHNYSDDHNPGLTGSPVRVELRQGDELTVFSPTAAMGETSSQTWWTVFQLVVDAQCNVTITPMGIFSTGASTGPVSPALPVPAARQYCVR